MVHMDFICFCSAQLTNSGSQPFCKAVGFVIFYVLREYIGGQGRQVCLFSEAIMIKLTAFRAAFCHVGDREHIIPLVLLTDFITGGVSLRGQSLEKAAFHDEIEIVQHRYVLGQAVEVV